MTIQRITVVGAGTMGHGIAQVAAQAGYDVVLQDVTGEMVERGLARMKDNLAKGVEKGKLTESQVRDALARLRCSSDLREATYGADLVIEAIVEELEAKKQLLAQLESTCGTSTIFATNTSSLSIAAIASAAKTRGRVIGMHFFNPVHIMKLVEVVVGPETTSATQQSVIDVASKMGKEAISVKDFPGFATSRLGVAVGLEAMRMVEQGVASAEDIDKAMVLGYNHPMGPLRLTDLVGLDIRLSIADYLYKELGSEVFRAPEILRSKVKEGKVGKKVGQGLYEW